MENCWGGRVFYPYFDPEYDSLTERMNPASVSVDNETCADTTLVKVDGVNKHGILLEMVQVLTDLDLVISKSYVSSDGVWVMDVFHVTDQFGCKLRDCSIISYLQQSLTSARLRGGVEPVKTCLGRVVTPSDSPQPFTAADRTASLELTAADRPGILSELSAVIVRQGCLVLSGQAWTHNSRAACILYLENAGDSSVNELEDQLEHVIAAHHGPGERWRLRLTPARLVSPIQVERRLHQLMHKDRDFESGDRKMGTEEIDAKVSIENCKEKGYSVVGIRSKDRPKLLFDTVCTLTDLDYVVFHATVSSHGPLAFQEYFIRRADGRQVDSGAEQRKMARCLMAAVKRRVSQGLRLKVRTQDRVGLLSEVTRVFREHGLTMTGAEIGKTGDSAMGSFCVLDASGGMVEARTMESLRKEIGGEVALEVEDTERRPQNRKTSRTSTAGGSGDSPGKLSLGSLLWSQIGRLSNNFGSIRS